jgi:predicted Zn-dependent protease
LKTDYAAAITAFRESLALLRGLATEGIEVAATWNELAHAEQLSGNRAEAERAYREALRVSRAMGHAQGIATATGNLAALELDRKEWLARRASQ